MIMSFDILIACAIQESVLPLTTYSHCVRIIVLSHFVNWVNRAVLSCLQQACVPQKGYQRREMSTWTQHIGYPHLKTKQARSRFCCYRNENILCVEAYFLEAIIYIQTSKYKYFRFFKTNNFLTVLVFIFSSSSGLRFCLLFFFYWFFLVSVNK